MTPHLRPCRTIAGLVYYAPGDERAFFVHLPVGYAADTERRWPIIFFLHGGGERGDGGNDLASLHTSQWAQVVTER